MIIKGAHFTEQRQVLASEIDDLDHVNNVVYLKWVQDIAEHHWQKLIEHHQDTPFVWVVFKHEITYRAAAFVNDIITLNTWVGHTSGVTSIRHVEIYKGDVLLAEAQTTWCLVDAKSHKPTRINSTVEKILLGN